MIREFCISALIAFIVPLSVFSQGKIDSPSKYAKHKVSKNNVSYDVNQYEPIDLGLSVKWANQNMGATKTNICGYKFGWSELTPRKAYSWKDNNIPKIENISSNSKYDVASAKLGNGWRMPTLDEMKELKEKCKWVYSTNKKGYDIYGPNGNSIFMPIIEQNHNAEYWTGTRKNEDIHLAHNLFFTNCLVIVSCSGIGNANMIRPVKE